MPNYRVVVEGQEFLVEIPDLAERPVRAIVEGRTFEVEVAPQPAADPVVDARSAQTPSEPSAPIKTTATPSPPEAPGGLSAPASGSDGEVKAPLPGTIVGISVSEGDRIERGQELCVLEAMKMNNPIRATQSGIVKRIFVSIGQQIQHDTVLMEIDEA